MDPDTLTIFCHRCGRDIAQVRRLMEQDGPEWRATWSQRVEVVARDGQVRDESTTTTRRYRLACGARRHAPEVRVFTEAALADGLSSSFGVPLRRSLTDIRRPA